jgi:hypothetical protein
MLGHEEGVAMDDGDFGGGACKMCWLIVPEIENTIKRDRHLSLMCE